MTRLRYPISLVCGDEQDHFVSQIDLTPFIDQFATEAARRHARRFRVEVQVSLPDPPPTPYTGRSVPPNIERIFVGNFAIDVSAAFEPRTPQSTASQSPDPAAPDPAPEGSDFDMLRGSAGHDESL